MDNSYSKSNHCLSMQNREQLTLDGIKDVSVFNEEEIVAESDYGSVIIKGVNLHIEVLQLDTGDLKLTGKITAIIYNDTIKAKGFIRRLLS